MFMVCEFCAGQVESYTRLDFCRDRARMVCYSIPDPVFSWFVILFYAFDILRDFFCNSSYHLGININI